MSNIEYENGRTTTIMFRAEDLKIYDSKISE